jgi:hypothetical protein
MQISTAFDPTQYAPEKTWEHTWFMTMASAARVLRDNGGCSEEER